VIDIKKKDEETREEEEEGEVEQCQQQRFNNPRNMHVVNTVRKECMDSRSLVWTGPGWLSNSSVSPYP